MVWEGVVFYKDDKIKVNVFFGVRWIKISRKMVNFEVFIIGKE